ncbi:hypothetical protein [Methylobacterium sp. Leaf86]|uniref:hypothetical protein n=1 Tax=Methylobacterium sp. Leaf86 TaxID=1736242 RepID=UPI000A6DF1EB|nr:hypothetical protein [Methylobacterium sp. Leaf86]
MSAEQHPVIKALRRSNVLDSEFVDYLAEHGRSYQGVPLHKDVVPWPLGSCLEASEALEQHRGWQRIEGWILLPSSYIEHRQLFYHNWNSSDGITAIDASLPDPVACIYLGVPAESDLPNRMIVGKPRKPAFTIHRPHFAYSGIHR